jgi:hypothetical protein
MILVGESHSTRRKTCLSTTLSTTNLTWIRPRSSPDLRGDRPATNSYSHCRASLKIEIRINNIRKFSSYFKTTPRLITTTNPVLVFRELFLNDLRFGLYVNTAVWRRDQINLARRTEMTVTARCHIILTQSSPLVTKTFSGQQHLTAGTELHAVSLRNRGSISGKVNSFSLPQTGSMAIWCTFPCEKSGQGVKTIA